MQVYEGIVKDRVVLLPEDVHLASAVALQQMREVMDLPSHLFVSADAQQRETAAVEGFPVEDPNEHG